MFGVVFTGHPSLEPLLLPEEAADLKPLLKEAGEVKPADLIRRAPAAAETGTAEPDPER
jgi:hypothetical protein